jgi:hypothetical protein
MKALLVILFSFVGLAAAEPVSVSLKGNFGLFRGGKPYFVRGAGGETHLKELAARGANSIRTWSTNNLVETLDEAQKLGLTVSAGIWLESECSWFSYSNAEHCARQTERVRTEILQFRDHPALLAWGLGNEAEGDGRNISYWKQIERLALLAKELDPAHLTFTAVAGLSAEKAQGLNEHTPHLDYVGVNTYGALFGLPKSLVKIGWTRPWMLTEWGPRGFWEQPKSQSGAALEQTSSEKAAMMRRGYSEIISNAAGCLGSYAFVWGWKFEATATWFGLMTHEGETIESVDVLEEMWSGQKPTNSAPQIQRMEGVPIEALKPGSPFQARTEASDADGDPLIWHWSVLPEKTNHDAGKRPKMPDAIPGAILSSKADQVEVTAPQKPGVYRLHVWISDGKGHAATANVPFEVK